MVDIKKERKKLRIRIGNLYQRQQEGEEVTEEIEACGKKLMELGDMEKRDDVLEYKEVPAMAKKTEAAIKNRHERTEYYKWRYKAIENGVNPAAFRYRLNAGYTFEEAVQKVLKTKPKNKPMQHSGKRRSEVETNGVNYGTYKSRLRRGWSVEDAMTKIVKVQKMEQCGDLETYRHWKEVALQNGINKNTYRGRLSRGWTHQDAAEKRPTKEMTNKWVMKAEKNGILPGTYKSRLRLGWTKEDASTVPVGSRYADRTKKKKRG